MNPGRVPSLARPSGFASSYQLTFWGSLQFSITQTLGLRTHWDFEVRLRQGFPLDGNVG